MLPVNFIVTLSTDFVLKKFPLPQNLCLCVSLSLTVALCPFLPAPCFYLESTSFIPRALILMDIFLKLLEHPTLLINFLSEITFKEA